MRILPWLIALLVPMIAAANGIEGWPRAKRAFVSFTKKFGRVYSSEREMRFRFGVFLRNYLGERLWERKGERDSPRKRVNQFADLLDSEFKGRFAMPREYLTKLNASRPLAYGFITSQLDARDPEDQAFTSRLLSREIDIVDIALRLRDASARNLFHPSLSALTAKQRKVILERVQPAGLPRTSGRRLQAYNQGDIARDQMTTVDGLSLPVYVNWRRALTKVKDQGDCDSCYAFSGMAAMESNYALKTNLKESFSEQEVLDCSTRNRGCRGGQAYMMYDYIIINGVSREADYPYTGRDGPCLDPKRPLWRHLTGYHMISKGVMALLKAVQMGTVSVSMHASRALKFHYKGMYRGEGCEEGDKLYPDHSAQLYGYDLRGPTPFLMFKNGWGTSWGDKGLFKMAIGPLNDGNMGECRIGSTEFNVMPIIDPFL